MQGARAEPDEVLWPDEDEPGDSDSSAFALPDPDEQLLIDEDDLEHYRRVQERLARRDPDLPEWLELDVIEELDVDVDDSIVDDSIVEGSIIDDSIIDDSIIDDSIIEGSIIEGSIIEGSIIESSMIDDEDQDARVEPHQALDALPLETGAAALASADPLEEAAALASADPLTAPFSPTHPGDVVIGRVGELKKTDPIRAPLWGSINAMIYALNRGLRGMAQSSLVQLLAIGTMAVCMLLLGTTTLLFVNARAVATGWGIDVPVTVYMQPGVDSETTEALRDKLAELPEVERAERVTPAQALARLDEGVGEHAELLAGIDPSALPDSIELAFVPGVETGFAEALAGRVQGMSGVDEVAVLGPWVHEAEAMLTTLRWLAIGVAILVSFACLAIVWSTIRLGVFARRAELEILRLVGGTSRFVRAPFLIEGMLQGLLGTALALAGLWLAFDLIRPLLEQGLALMFAAGSIRFFAPLELGIALAFGALLGLLGSRAAVARHAEA